MQNYQVVLKFWVYILEYLAMMRPQQESGMNWSQLGRPGD